MTLPPAHSIVTVLMPASNHDDYRARMDLYVHDTAEDVAVSVAARISNAISTANGGFNLGLAGGSTPAATYSHLRDAGLDWSDVDLWLSDERWVAPDSPRSNGRMACEVLGAAACRRLARPGFSSEFDPDQAAAAYTTVVKEIFGDSEPDLVLLGLGEDGHTASLFPGTAALDVDTTAIVANWVPDQEEHRLTATFPLLWSASGVIFQVTGRQKAPALRDSLDGTTPAGRVGEGQGRVEWHVDRDAAYLLS